jgi:hypothetical protein
MTKASKHELLSIIKQRYLKSGVQEKHNVLNEYCKVTGFNRKYATRILQAKHLYKTSHKKRPLIYQPDLLSLIIKIWELLDYPCGKRLAPSLLTMAQALERSKEIIPITEYWQKQLRSISPNTLDRRLKRERIIRRLSKNRGATRHGTLLKTSVPIRITNWNTRKIGFMEMDTVAHCGNSLSGQFIYSLDMVEIATGWSEQRAVMGKGQTCIVQAIEDIKQSIPFKLLGLDSDTGSEFVNWHMVRWCKENKLFFTRSRPDRKNDNAYVEQKNYTHIRKALGYRRYDSQQQLELINDLYKNELRIFNNFFKPVMKIRSKEKINNSVAKKKYDQAKTPYARLMLSGQISEIKKKELKELYEMLNPVKLKAAIDTKLQRIQKS